MQGYAKCDRFLVRYLAKLQHLMDREIAKGSRMTRIDEDGFFREVTVRITSSLEIKKALARTFEYLKQFIPMEVISLHYYVPERAAAYTMASFSQTQGAVGLDETAPLIRIDKKVMDKLRQEGATVDEDRRVAIFNRPKSDPIYRAIARFLEPLGLSCFSNLMLRLDIHGDYQGVMLISAGRHDAFTQEHARLIQIVAEPIAIALSNARRHWETQRLKDLLAEDNKAMHRDLEHLTGNQVVGADFGLRRVMELVRKVAPMNCPILLEGETGTGKEVIANAIHMASPRRDGPLVRVQCGAIPETLLASELFGHEKGAFTGAVQAKRGRFERADHGTIFLDEIGEITLDAQVELLRVLQEKEFERLGGTHTVTVDVRVIAATNRNLAEMVQRGRFREDLWFRLNVFPIQLPPLRHRKEDIPALVQWLIDRKAREMGLPEQPAMGPGAVDQLLAYHWPGNVRELQNVIERALILCQGLPLQFPHLGLRQPAYPQAAQGEKSEHFFVLDRVVSDHIRQALSLSGGRIQGDSGAAKLLGVNSSTLRARMRKLGIPFGRNAP